MLYVKVSATLLVTIPSVAYDVVTYQFIYLLYYSGYKYESTN